jgi:hypothetical protein
LNYIENDKKSKQNAEKKAELKAIAETLEQDKDALMAAPSDNKSIH